MYEDRASLLLLLLLRKWYCLAIPRMTLDTIAHSLVVANHVHVSVPCLPYLSSTHLSPLSLSRLDVHSRSIPIPMNTRGFESMVATSPRQDGGYLGTSPSAAFTVSLTALPQVTPKTQPLISNDEPRRDS